VSGFVTELLCQSPDEYGDLFVDVGDAFLAESVYDQALLLYLPLAGHATLDQPALWEKEVRAA